MINKKHILLIRPENIYGVKNYPPFGLIQIGTILSEKGYDVRIMINDGDPQFGEKILEEAKDALFVGFTSTTAEIKDAIRLARLLRKTLVDKLHLVWGGWHTTLFPEQMENSDLVDFGVMGEGDNGIIEIAKYISHRSDLVDGNIATVSSATNVGSMDESFYTTAVELQNNNCLKNKVIKTSIVDLENLPLSNYGLVKDIETYITRPLTDKFQEYYCGEMRWLPYESSRGCPYRCAFCINSVTGNSKYRVKSPKKVAYEMSELATKYCLTHVKIIDDNFFVQIDRVREIFKEVELLGVKYTWDAECRVDYIRKGFMDDEMFKFLKKNGLQQLTFGIESGSHNTLKRMRKGGNAGPSFAIAAIDMCAKHDITVRGSFVLDIPGDTSDDILATVKLIRRLRQYPKFACGVHTYRPYPKSPLCEQLVREEKFYQPITLEEWESEVFVRQYTDTAITRTWQANYRLSSNVSFYESLESAFWLKPHQFVNPVLKFINNVFIMLARFRNQHQLYSFPLDKRVYILFKDICIKYFINRIGKIK